MALPNIFEKEANEQIIERLYALTHESKPLWGKMNVAQMLAHCNVTYDLAFGRKSQKSNFVMKLILKALVKNTVVNEVAYPKNSRTAPIFLIADEKDFDKEKALLLENLKTVEAKGATYFDGKDSDSFGKLSATEWNNMFYKHLNHHLSQFGV